MIIFEKDKLKRGEVRKDGSLRSKNIKSKISLFSYFTEKAIIRDGTTLENLIWSFLNDSNSDQLSKTVSHLTEGRDILKFFRKKVGNGTKGRFIDVDWLEFVSSPVIIDSDKKQKFIQKYQEDWKFTAWRKKSEKQVDTVNISTISFNSLLSVPIDQKYETIVYDKNYEEVGRFRSLPTVAEILETLTYEFYLFREISNREEEGYGLKRKNLSSLNDLS